MLYYFRRWNNTIPSNCAFDYPTSVRQRKTEKNKKEEEREGKDLDMSSVSPQTTSPLRMEAAHSIPLPLFSRLTQG